MKEIFKSATDFYSNIGADGVFAICLITVFAAFCITLIQALFKRGYGIKKRTWYLLVVSGVSLFEYGVAALSGEGTGFCALTFGLGVILFTPLYAIRVKEQTRKEQRALVKLIDGHINGDYQTVNQVEKAEKTPAPPYDVQTALQRANCVQSPKETPRKKQVEIDFTHVKNVLERLEFFTLSPSDRKQVKDLETAVFAAECGEMSEPIKSKINDGLSALLKIMAKYGI